MKILSLNFHNEKQCYKSNFGYCKIKQIRLNSQFQLASSPRQSLNFLLTYTKRALANISWSRSFKTPEGLGKRFMMPTKF